MKLLEARNLSHAFDYELFKDISFSLDEKQSIAIIGISGSGKSTLLHILSSLLPPKEGEVYLFGENIYETDAKTLTDIKRNKIGLVFQSHYLFKGFTAYENLEVAEILAQQEIDTALLEELEIEHVIHQKVTELSGGQQQRVSIARVLTKKPKLIFADEPTGNLDKKTAHKVMHLFFEYLQRASASMMLVTHDTELAMMCDCVYRLEDKVLQKVK